MTMIRSLFRLAVAISALTAVPSNAKPNNVPIVAIEGAATDCSEYQFQASLSNAVTLSYVVTAPNDGSPATFSAEFTYEGNAWVALGFAGDDKGVMAGSDAIIGLPDENIVQKYQLQSADEAGVIPRVEAQQTLTDTYLNQGFGRTTMRFTKILEESDEIALQADGQHVLLWAHGDDSNVLGPHDRRNGAGAFWLDFTPCVPSSDAPDETQDSSPNDTEDPLDGTPGQTVDEVVSTIDENADCSEYYQYSVAITNDLTMSYVVNLDEETGGTISVKMEYEGEGWLGFGVSSDGKMVGSEAIIGIPAAPLSQSNPGMYQLLEQATSGVLLLDEEQQTLTDATISQVDGTTIMTFTKPLIEPTTELGISGDGSNIFVWAIGYSNTLGLHRSSGAFRIDLSPCSTGEGGDATGPAVVTTVQSSKYTAEQKRKFWKAHGAFGFLAWGLCAPAAVFIAFFRNLFRPDSRLWLKLHMWLNVGTFIFTVFAFSFAVAMHKDSGEPHFDNTHGAVGLVITLFVMLQTGAGIFRPSKRKHNPSQQEIIEKEARAGIAATQDDDSSKYDFQMLDIDGTVEVGKRPRVPYADRPDAIEVGSAVFTPASSCDDDSYDEPPPPPGNNVYDAPVDVDTLEDDKAIEVHNAIDVLDETAETTKHEAGKDPVGPYGDDGESSRYFSHLQIRAGWETAHKMAGYYLLGMGLWQIQDGLVQYSLKYDTTSLAPVFWSLFGVVACFILVIAVYVRIRNVV